MKLSTQSLWREDLTPEERVEAEKKLKEWFEKERSNE